MFIHEFSQNVIVFLTLRTAKIRKLYYDYGRARIAKFGISRVGGNKSRVGRKNGGGAETGDNTAGAADLQIKQTGDNYYNNN